MLTRHSRENSIGFLETDYDALAKEVEAINNKKNDRPSPPIRLAKQTSGNIYKQRSLVNFLETEVPAPAPVEASGPQPEKAKKLLHDFDPQATGLLQSSKSISSARTGMVGDQGGPSKYIKSDSANSIWNPNRIEQLAQAIDPQRESAGEKVRIQENRRLAEQERMNELAAALKETDQRKASHVSALATQEGTPAFKQPTGNSIFDDQHEFSRVPEKTAGEVAAEAAKTEERERLENGRVLRGKVLSSSDVTSRLFDKLMMTKPTE